MHLNQYYEELIDFITRECGLDKTEKIIYSNYYLTIDDYLLAVSQIDSIKSILALMKQLRGGVHVFLRETIAIIIQEILRGYEQYERLYGRYVKIYF